jgi:ABC-type siderophore export system fused ATPase/permease subunit
VLSPLIRRHRTSLALATLLAAASGAISISLLATINQLAAAGLSRGNLAPIWNGLGWLAALVGLSAGSQILLARLGADEWPGKSPILDRRLACLTNSLAV